MKTDAGNCPKIFSGGMNMNKDINQLREELAKALASMDNWRYEDLSPTACTATIDVFGFLA